LTKYIPSVRSILTQLFCHYESRDGLSPGSSCSANGHRKMAIRVQHVAKMRDGNGNRDLWMGFFVDLWLLPRIVVACGRHVWSTESE
jgi:hypothetical protein